MGTEFNSPALDDLEATRELNAFLDAAKAGDVDGVVGHLEGVGTPVDACVPQYRRTALHWACEGGHRDVCVALIDAQADVNFWDRSGATPLHWAAWNSHVGICELLVEHKADPFAKDNDNETALDSSAVDAATKAALNKMIAGQTQPGSTDSALESPSRPWTETSGRVNQTVKTLVDETVRLHDMVEQLVEQNGRLMENQQLLVAEVKRLRQLLGQPVDDSAILQIPVPEQEEY